MGGDRRSALIFVYTFLFQFTPPRGGRLGARLFCHWYMIFQFTPPRGGRPFPQQSPRRIGISIHAPAWGATLSIALLSESFLFQFTPPRGGRLVGRFVIRAVSKFQFTPPRGGRLRSSSSPASVWISIHAPAWGATWPHIRAACGRIYFNSRPRVGGD